MGLGEFMDTEKYGSARGAKSNFGGDDIYKDATFSKLAIGRDRIGHHTSSLPVFTYGDKLVFTSISKTHNLYPTEKKDPTSVSVPAEGLSLKEAMAKANLLENNTPVRPQSFERGESSYHLARTYMTPEKPLTMVDKRDNSEIMGPNVSDILLSLTRKTTKAEIFVSEGDGRFGHIKIQSAEELPNIFLLKQMLPGLELTEEAEELLKNLDPAKVMGNILSGSLRELDHNLDPKSAEETISSLERDKISSEEIIAFSLREKEMNYFPRGENHSGVEFFIRQDGGGKSAALNKGGFASISVKGGRKEIKPFTADLTYDDLDGGGQ